MSIVETNLPLADILVETGMGIVAMNAALEPNNVGATEADVSINFMASLQRGFNYSRTNKSGGAVFTFWLIGGAGAASYTKTELHLYSQYCQYINIRIGVKFRPLANVA